MSKSDAATAKSVLAAYGKEGVKNGVVVAVGKNMGDYPATTSTKNGVTTVSINPGITSGKLLSAYGGGSEGAIVGHEGIHIIDERGALGGATREPLRKAMTLNGEPRILRVEYSGRKALPSMAQDRSGITLGLVIPTQEV